MKLYLLRHADAEATRTTDAARELTPKGHAQAALVAQHCRREEIRPGVVLTSPFRRARQTAEPVANAVGAPVQTETFLASGMTPETALAELRAYGQFAEVMIVGHQPDLGDLIGTLIAAENFPVGKASLTCLECAEFSPGAGELRWTRSVQEM